MNLARWVAGQAIRRLGTGRAASVAETAAKRGGSLAKEDPLAGIDRALPYFDSELNKIINPDGSMESCLILEQTTADMERREKEERERERKTPELNMLSKAQLVTPCEEGLLAWAVPGRQVPEKPSSHLAAEAKRLFQSGCDYVGTARRAAHVAALNTDSPQVCFLGRSNVGKSSLINTLFSANIRGRDRKSFAQVSNTPGRTQALHLFGAGRNDSWKHRRSMPLYRVVLIDCPGYGFARINEQGSEAMAKAIAEFLENRDQRLFSRAFVLIDSELGFSNNDLQMRDMLEHLRCHFQVVLTKCDKLSRSKMEETVEKALTCLASERFTRCSPLLLGVTTKGKFVQPLMDRLRSEIVMQCDNHLFLRKRSLKRTVQT